MIYLNFYFSSICQSPNVFTASEIVSTLSEFVFQDAASCQTNTSGGKQRFQGWLQSTYPEQAAQPYSSFPILMDAMGEMVDMLHPVVAAGYSMSSQVPSSTSLNAASYNPVGISVIYKQLFKDEYFKRNKVYPDDSVDFNEFILAISSFLFTCYPL